MDTFKIDLWFHFFCDKKQFFKKFLEYPGFFVLILTNLIVGEDIFYKNKIYEFLKTLISHRMK